MFVPFEKGYMIVISSHNKMYFLIYGIDRTITLRFWFMIQCITCDSSLFHSSVVMEISDSWTLHGHGQI
ncbi:hypothetical protein Lalb_Chr12g0207471 [Lupinus albus]|uniref:Uncharacterized protein n=1 Tax=Lupinus albus TaxID=3870 RepID=A0A6A4PPI1_LUPAL|nr:hypothetical protein Lalb_Chr12g0207471 [Lupinus albus]